MLKLLGYYGTHWRAGNRPPFSSGTGFVAGRTFVCLFVCCVSGGWGNTHHMTKCFFNNAGGLHGTNISFLANQPDHPVTTPCVYQIPDTRDPGGPESWWTSLFRFVLLLFLDPVSGSATQYNLYLWVPQGRNRYQLIKSIMCKVKPLPGWGHLQRTRGSRQGGLMTE